MSCSFTAVLLLCLQLYFFFSRVMWTPTVIFVFLYSCQYRVHGSCKVLDVDKCVGAKWHVKCINVSIAIKLVTNFMKIVSTLFIPLLFILILVLRSVTTVCSVCHDAKINAEIRWPCGSQLSVNGPFESLLHHCSAALQRFIYSDSFGPLPCNVPRTSLTVICHNVLSEKRPVNTAAHGWFTVGKARV